MTMNRIHQTTAGLYEDELNNWKIHKPLDFYSPIAPPVRNAPELRLLHATGLPVQSEYAAERRAAAAVPLLESP